MPKVYELRHTFNARVGGEEIYFTRDNEHRLSEITEKDLKGYVDKGYVVVTEVAPADAREIREAQEEDAGVVEGLSDQQANIDAAEHRGAKPTPSTKKGGGK